MDDLRYVGAEVQIARLQDDLDRRLAATRRGRAALRIFRWARRRRRTQTTW